MNRGSVRISVPQGFRHCAVRAMPMPHARVRRRAASRVQVDMEGPRSGRRGEKGRYRIDY